MNPLDLNKESENVSNENSLVTDETQLTENAIAVEEKTIEIVENSSTDNEAEIITEKIVIPEKEKPNYNLFTKNELVEALNSLIDQEVLKIKDEVELIKQCFYKKLKTEVEIQKNQFIEDGGEVENFVPVKDELEEKLKDLLNDYRVKKAAQTAIIEQEKETNLIQKNHILSQMKVLVESNEDVSAHIKTFRELQNKWKLIGQVPASNATELWKSYNSCQESFWDLVKINNELREYDFKKNLEIKTQLCEAAEKLINHVDTVSAFKNLQKLHEDWHESGPVSRDLRETLWTRFKDASTLINKRHQDYFDTVRKLENDNFEAKNALCDKLESFEYKTLNNYKAWEDATAKIIQIQEQWRSIGFAPRKVNQKLFERYRQACDDFFTAKKLFFKASKDVLNENLDKKKALCLAAESLKDSKEWKETSDKFVQLQREWKSTGPLAKRNSNDLWKRFIDACDYFYEQKAKSTSGQNDAELQNLAKKHELIDKINKLNKVESPTESLTNLRALMAEWNEIGFVPFKEKDKIHNEYRAAIDKQFETLNIDSSQRRLDNFKSNIQKMSGRNDKNMNREREKLMGAYEHLKSEISTYENNIGFLSTSSKKGSVIIKEMERKIEALKEERKLIEKKINLIDESN
jgi:hypothetical protein